MYTQLHVQNPKCTKHNDLKNNQENERIGANKKTIRQNRRSNSPKVRKSETKNEQREYGRHSKIEDETTKV